MNKTVATIANFIKPGKTLMILGPYGCGKSEASRQAIRNLGLKDYSIDLRLSSYEDIRRYPLPQGGFAESIIGAFIKTIPGNGALVIDGIEKITPEWVVFILEQMLHPDRPTILTGLECSSLIIASRCEIIKMIGLV